MYATNIQNFYKKNVIKRNQTINSFNKFDIEKTCQLINRSKRPIVYIGGGLINSGNLAVKQLKKFGDLSNFPVTSTLMGLGAFPASSKLFLGMLGMHGTYEANMAMHECDLMINIGARFDDRITGRLDKFS